MHFIVDGYNLLYALPRLPTGTLENKRSALLRWLNQERPQGRNPLTVIFDSRAEGGEHQQRGETEVLFTSRESADDWIIRFVRRTPSPRAVTVVTNDLGLRAMIRGTGAKWMSADAFVQAKRSGSPSTKAHPSIDHDTITDELRKKWL